MRYLNYIFLVFALLIPFNIVNAQFGDESRKAAPRKMNVRPERPASRVKTSFGVYGHVHGGFSWGFMSKLETNLQKDEVFTKDWYQRTLASHYGGKIMFQLGNMFLLGGGFSGYSFDASLASFSKEELGEASYKSHFFSPYLGIVVFNRAYHEYSFETNQYDFKYRWMLYPFVGLGVGGKNTLRLANYSQKAKYFGDQTSDGYALIPRAESREFTTQLMLLELGVGTQFMKKNNGGLMVGAELGGYFNLNKGKWKDAQNVEIKGVDDATLSGFYLRFTVGGGFFKNKDVVAGKSKGDGYVKPAETEEPKTEEPKPEKPKKEKKKKEKPEPEPDKSQEPKN